MRRPPDLLGQFLQRREGVAQGVLCDLLGNPIPQRLQAQDQRGEQLPGFVVQFAGDPPPFVFLDCGEPRQEAGPQQLLGLLFPADVVENGDGAGNLAVLLADRGRTRPQPGGPAVSELRLKLFAADGRSAQRACQGRLRRGDAAAVRMERHPTAAVFGGPVSRGAKQPPAQRVRQHHAA